MRLELQRPTKIKINLIFILLDTLDYYVTCYCAHGIGIHLRGQSFHQLRHKLIHQVFALIGNKLNRDECTGTFKYFQEFSLQKHEKVNF